MKGPLKKSSRCQLDMLATNHWQETSSPFLTVEAPALFFLLFPLLWLFFLAEILAKGPQAFEVLASPPHLSPNPYSESLSLPSSSLSSTITWHKIVSFSRWCQNTARTSLTGLLSTGVTGADFVRPKSIVRLEWLRFLTWKLSVSHFSNKEIIVKTCKSLAECKLFKYRCKSRGRHLLLVSIVVFPLHLGLAPVAKVVVECFRGLLHLARKAYELASCFENWVITFTLRDPNLRILGFFSILLVLCFLLIWERWYENQIFDDITYLSMFGMCHCSY